MVRLLAFFASALAGITALAALLLPLIFSVEESSATPAEGLKENLHRLSMEQESRASTASPTKKRTEMNPTRNAKAPVLSRIQSWSLDRHLTVLGILFSMLSLLVGLYAIVVAKGSTRLVQAAQFASQRAQAEQHLHQAWDLLGGEPGKTVITKFTADSVNLAKAKREICAALALEPQNQLARLRLGTYHELLGERSIAQAIYEDLIAEDPNFAAAHHNLGCVLQLAAIQGEKLDISMLKEAEKHHRQSIELSRDSASYHNLGANLIYQGELIEAEKIFEEAILVDSGDVISHSNLGIVRYRLETFEGAAEAFRRATEIDSDYAPAFNGLGTALFALARYDDAADAHRRAIDLNEDHVYAYRNLGHDLQKLQRFTEAVECFEKASKIDSLNGENLFFLGCAALKAKDFSKAAVAFTSAVAMKNTDVQAINGLGVAYARKGKIRSAVEQFRKAVALDSDFLPAKKNLEKYESVLDQLQEDAIMSYGELVSAGIENSITLCKMGEVYRRLGELDDATLAFEEAIRCDPECAEAQNGLGEILQMKGASGKAAHFFTRAKELDPEFIAAYLNLAALYNQEGRLSESIRIYRQAMEIAPNELKESLELHEQIALRTQADVGEVSIAAGCEGLEPCATGLV